MRIDLLHAALMVPNRPMWASHKELGGFAAVAAPTGLNVKNKKPGLSFESPGFGFQCNGNDQMARSTLLERRHLVQTYTWRGVPSTTALTRLTLGFHILLERLWEWDTLIPNVTPLPQISHFAIGCTSHP